MTEENDGEDIDARPPSMGSRDPGAGVQFDFWDPEDEGFWEESGKRLANRNLWISIPNLFLGFAIWMVWGVIVTKIQGIHDLHPDLYSFSEWGGGLTGDEYKALLYTLAALPGLAGATFRIPNSFMISISGGRNVIAATTLLLLLPMVGAGIALQDPDVAFLTLLTYAVMSGVGGGAFASSMSNISFFFPRKMQGLTLGLNAGLGNLGVSAMQFSVPIVMGFALFGGMSGSAIGGYYVADAALLWVPFCAFFMIAAWLWMNNMPEHDVANTTDSLKKYIWLEGIGYIAAGIGVSVLVASRNSEAFDSPLMGIVRIFVMVALAVALTLCLMRYATPAPVKESLLDQWRIFGEKHNWLMTWLYLMTFGSFIGFSAVFPKLILDVFGYLPDGSINPWYDDHALTYAFLGPLVGALIRPVGGWMGDKWGGARVTHWDTIVMIFATIGVGLIIVEAKASQTPEDFFLPFMALFIILFTTTGIGNGSTFRMIAVIFPREQAGPVLGWTSAIAAYGAFIIPSVFAVSIAAKVPEYAMYGFATYYVSCLGVNWWYYARKDAEMPC
ncbi:MAG: MFS transporter [Candidatus Thalassarchaeaceae archaeon]|nr:MFS transporter [Candidatus Thalassarchaeaceae archaeon]MDP7256860.1 MFS transporter [Candidatus Thalassarchaeaceae archaeon]MDP7446100.1 MFS transporter [Candidatus Thalassarchaeaceae archaeon]MDP7649458.1 MFS transporter [Candidatus Thalassarchaeaceae archaeon]HJL55432.1 MFS transporter [Candidatus Thalassarchaeaceae archaeon]